MNGATRTFAYDAVDQLTSDNGSSVTYDLNGNRTVSGYTTGANNQLTNDGTWTYTYDAEGNVSSRTRAGCETWNYSYDFDNHLTGAIQSGTGTSRVTYVYDAFGNRIERLAWNGSSATVERYVQDGWDTAKPGAVANENFDTILDLDSTNHVTMRRLYGDGQDDLIGRQTSTGTVAYYLTDHQGSVQGVVNSSGAVVGTLMYDGFGKVTTNTGSTDRYQSTGREKDDLLNLMFYRGRVLDPVTLRFFGLDQSSFSAGDANLYRYVGNSPTNGRDPSGLDWNDFRNFVEKKAPGVLGVADRIVDKVVEQAPATPEQLVPAIGRATGEVIVDLVKDTKFDPVAYERDKRIVVETVFMPIVIGEALVNAQLEADRIEEKWKRHADTYGKPMPDLGPTPILFAVKEGWLGLGTGAKITVNAAAYTLFGFGTLGFDRQAGKWLFGKEDWEIATLRDDEKTAVVPYAQMSSRFGCELYLGTVTGSGSTVSRFGKTVWLLDAAGNLSSVGQGSWGLYENGWNSGDGLKVVGGSAGLGGNYGGRWGGATELPISGKPAYTGARTLPNPNAITQAEAEKVYVWVRGLDAETNIATVAKNTGIPEHIVRSVRQHVFLEKHLLPTNADLTGKLVMRRFDAAEDIAAWWKAATEGGIPKSELARVHAIFAHEYVERSLMKTGMHYRDAHSFSPLFPNGKPGTDLYRENIGPWDHLPK